MSDRPRSPSSELTRYLASAAGAPLPDSVTEATKLHVLDTVAAVISGSALAAGRQGQVVARAIGGPAEAMIFGSGQLVGSAAAALANGMAAHADETDDSHAPSLSHPGCAIVPAAIAVAERRGADGTALLRAVAAGYDAGCRVGRALGRPATDLRYSRPSSHAIVGTFGAATAAAVLTGGDELAFSHTLSYAAQSCSGVTTWQRDRDHVEKAFVFAGGPAQSGILAALMVELGGTGVDDVFAGHPNYLDAMSADPNYGELSKELGQRYEMCATNIKKYCVGSPAQAAVQAAEEIARIHHPAAADIQAVRIALPADLAGVVDGRDMPDVNVQYLVAGTLLDGSCGFAMAHDVTRMASTDVKRLVDLTTVTADETRAETRSAELTIDLRDGSVLRQTVDHVRGTVDNPMAPHEVQAKAVDVMAPVIGTARAEAVVSAIEALESVPDIRHLRALFAVTDESGQTPLPTGT